MNLKLFCRQTCSRSSTVCILAQCAILQTLVLAGETSAESYHDSQYIYLSQSLSFVSWKRLMLTVSEHKCSNNECKVSHLGELGGLAPLRADHHIVPWLIPEIILHIMRELAAIVVCQPNVLRPEHGQAI